MSDPGNHSEIPFVQPPNGEVVPTDTNQLHTEAPELPAPVVECAFGIQNGLNQACFNNTNKPKKVERKRELTNQNAEDSFEEDDEMDSDEEVLLNNNDVENMEVDERDTEHDDIDGTNADENPKQIIELKSKTSFHMATPDVAPGVDGIVYEATFPSGVDLSELASVLSENSIGIHVTNSSRKPIGKNEAKHDRSTRPRYSSDGRPNNPPGGEPKKDPKPNIFFKDCGGLEQQVNFIKQAILEPLKGGSEAMKRFGIVPPKGILFYGPPGTGKTRLALALSNELNKILGKPVHFIYRKGKDVASKYFGQSSANLRRVFAEAKAHKPTVLFFDELDGLCPARDNVFQSEANVTLVTTMLGLIDELPTGQVFILGATNKLEVIDPALRRPGRFDKYLEFLPPNDHGRQEILRIHTAKWKTQPNDRFLKYLSSRTFGFTGADLCKLCLDAFDQGVARLIPENGKVEYDRVDFGNLTVQDADWTHVLKKFTPTSSTVFGSALYVPSDGLGEHVKPLIAQNLKNMNEMIGPLLPAKNRPMSSDVKGFYIWSFYDTNIGDIFISPLFRTPELADFSIYQLSSEVLASVSHRAWAGKIDAVFSQALTSHKPAIIYVPQVDEFWNAVQTAGLHATLNMAQQLERLRGKSVMIVGTGSGDPQDFPFGNPFQDAFSGVGRVYHVKLPVQLDRVAFFSPLFTNPKFHGEARNKNKNQLEDVLKRVIDATKDSEVTSMVELYDSLQQHLYEVRKNFVQKNKKETLSDQIIKTWYNVLQRFQENGLYP